MANTEITVQVGTILQSPVWRAGYRKGDQYTVTQVRVNGKGEHLSYLAVDKDYWAIVVYPAEIGVRWEVVDPRGSNSINL